MAKKGVQEFRDFYELAFVLTEQFNGYASATDEIDLLNEDYVTSKLQAIFESADLDILTDDDFGRGIIMGMVYMLGSIETVAEEDEDGIDS